MDKSYLLDIISKIERKKKEKRIIPSGVLRDDIMAEIHNEMQEALASLLSEERIVYQRTLNSWMVSLPK